MTRWPLRSPTRTRLAPGRGWYCHISWPLCVAFGSDGREIYFLYLCFMSIAIQESEALLSRLTRAEKAQLLQWLVRDLGDAFPGIESQPNVAGGAACLVRTRIPVWVLEQARRLGTSEADLLLAYPSLRAEDLANAWAYIRSHQEEINQSIAENEE